MAEIHVTNENINKKANIDSKDDDTLNIDDADSVEAEKNADEPSDEATAKSRRELEDYLDSKRLREELDDYKLDGDNDNDAEDQEKP